jgi:hypothetical protein
VNHAIIRDYHYTYDLSVNRLDAIFNDDAANMTTATTTPTTMDKTMDKILRKQAYLIMYKFLDGIFDNRRSQFDDDLPMLLGSMRLLDDGEPIDSALWEDWLDALPIEHVSSDEAFAGMINFLQMYVSRGDQGEITFVLSLLDKETHPDIYKKWLEFFSQVGSSPT